MQLYSPLTAPGGWAGRGRFCGRQCEWVSHVDSAPTAGSQGARSKPAFTRQGLGGVAAPESPHPISGLWAGGLVNDGPGGAWELCQGAWLPGGSPVGSGGMSVPTEA